MDVEIKQHNKSVQRKGDKRNIPPAAHREAERVAKNLFRLPPKPLKK